MRYKRLSDWLAWQETMHPRQVDLGLQRVSSVASYCQLLPLRCPVITVAGTNGKGSVVAMIESMLHARNYRVGSYMSPHINAYNERIRINQRLVADDLLCEAFDFIDRRRKTVSLSFFEFGTLAALYCFQRCSLDAVILEAGLGGRLDAVNIVDSDAAVIASIDLEHTDWLGKSRESIAAEKAGIMRAGKPVVCGDSRPPSSIERVALEKGAIAHQLNRDFTYHRRGHDRWSFRAGDYVLDELPSPALFGSVQFNNAACALQVLHLMEGLLPMDKKSIDRGLRHVNLPGRFQLAASRPKTVILDIAHNPSSARALAENLRSMPCDGKTHAVFSVLSDKDVTGIFRAMGEQIDVWHLLELNTGRALRLDVLQECAREAADGKPIHVYPSSQAALRRLESFAADGDRIVVFGSVIMVAEARCCGYNKSLSWWEHAESSNWLKSSDIV